MGNPNLFERLVNLLWHRPLETVEYYFAKRWLDKTFGEREYWGDFIHGCVLDSQASKND